MYSFTLDQVNYFVLSKQHLTDDCRVDDVLRIVRDIVGLHGTGFKEPYIALFARSRNFTRGQLDEELHVRRTLGKIRCMRGTLYILTRDMIPVVFAATRGMVEKLSRQYTGFRGISEIDFSALSASVMELLKGRQMTVAEIKAALRTPLNLAAVLNLMCDQGLLVRLQQANGWKSRSYRYGIFAEFFDDINLGQYSEAEAIAMLVGQYLRAFGPSSTDDIAWWTGLTKAKVREALKQIEKQVTEVGIHGLEGGYLILRSEIETVAGIRAPARPVVNLLPNLDPYLMGYKKRERYLDYKLYDYIFDRSGNVTSTILVNGRIAGIWDFSENDSLTKFCLLTDVDDDILKQIQTKSREMGRFLSGGEVEFRRVSGMVSLRERPPGAFMSPLRMSEGE